MIYISMEIGLVVFILYEWDQIHFENTGQYLFRKRSFKKEGR